LVKIHALPRDPNPYQELLYREVRRAGHHVRYAARLTPSHALNLLLLPLELAVYRTKGWRVLHVHWVFGFKLPGSERFPWLRRAAQAWFATVLAVSRLLRIRIVWTAHNVLPHDRVFHDDVAARRRLVRASDLVLVHSAATPSALAQIGAAPRRTALVGMGPFEPGANLPPVERAEGDALAVLFFGLIVEYKGVEDLLEAVLQVPSGTPIQVMVAGRCPDSELQRRLHVLAGRCGDRVSLRLERIPENEIEPLMAKANVVVLPFRRVTSSSSALLAMGSARVVVLPDLPAFAELPRDAVVLYDGSIDGLARVLREIERWTPARLAQVGAVARQCVRESSWAEVSQRTITAIEEVL